MDRWAKELEQLSKISDESATHFSQQMNVLRDEFSAVKERWATLLERQPDDKAVKMVEDFLQCKALELKAPTAVQRKAVMTADISGSGQSVPRTAERLLYYLLPRQQREHILGDLEEDYRTNFLPKFGPREARWMYRWHAIRSVAPMVLRSSVWAALLGWLWRKLGS